MVNHIQKGEFKEYDSEEEAELYRAGADRRLREDEMRAARELEAERRRQRELSDERRREEYERRYAPALIQQSYEPAVRSTTKKTP